MREIKVLVSDAQKLGLKIALNVHAYNDVQRSTSDIRRSSF